MLVAVAGESDTGILTASVKGLEDIAVDNHRRVIWAVGKHEVAQFDLAGKDLLRIPLWGQKPEERGRRCTDCIDGHDDDDDDERHEEVENRVALDPSDGSIWIGARHEVIKLSADGLVVVRLAGFRLVADVAVDVADGTCWVADGDEVLKLAADGGRVLSHRIEPGNRVQALTVDPQSHSVWLGTRKGVFRLDPQGLEVFRDPEPADIQDLKVDETCGVLWLVTKKRVIKYSGEGERLLDFYPVAMGKGGEKVERSGGENDNDEAASGNLVTLAVDTVDGSCWIATRKKVFLFSETGTPLRRLCGFKQLQALDLGVPKIGVTIKEPSDGAAVETDHTTVTGTITDPAARVTVNDRAAMVHGLAFIAPDVPLEPGENTIAAVATSLAHLTAIDTHVVTYHVAAGPEISLCAEPYLEQRPHPPGAVCESRELARWLGFVTGTVADTAGVVTINGVPLPFGTEVRNQGAVNQGKWEGDFFWAFVNIPQVDGVHYVTAVATDDRGGRSEAVVTFVRDTVPPAITVLSPADRSITNATSVTVAGLVDDPAAVVQMGMTGPELIPINGSFSARVMLGTEGWNYIGISARDQSYNISQAGLNVLRDTIPPQLAVASPGDGIVVNTATIAATGHLIDATPESVSVAVNGGEPQLLPLNGIDFSAAVTLERGDNTLRFQGVDKAGNSVSVTRQVSLDPEPPTVSITAPSAGGIVTGTVDIIAAADDQLAGVESVTFLVDDQPVSTLTKSPYIYQMDSMKLSAGPHTMTARAVDKAGNAAEASIPVTVASQLQVEITSPATGAVTSGATLLVKGRVCQNAGKEVGVVVDGIVAHQQGDVFAALVPLRLGTNPVTAIVTDVDGLRAEAIVTVEVSGEPKWVRVTTLPDSGTMATKADGTTSFDTTLEVEAYLPNPVAGYSWDVNGDGIPDQAGPTLATINATYTSPGLYFPSVTITDTLGNSYTDTVIVNVIDKGQLDALLKGKWAKMRTALANSDVEVAVSYYSNYSKENFRKQFIALMTYVKQIVSEMKTINFVRSDDNIAEYDLRIERSSTWYSFQVLFLRDSDGVWRIRNY